MPTRKLRLFLCHASDDKPAVRTLYASHKSVPWIDLWLDEENLLPGQDFDTVDLLVGMFYGSVTK